MSNNITKGYLKKAICENANSVHFIFSSKPCGIDFDVKDSKWTFYMWYGDKHNTYDSYDKMVQSPMFDGNTIYDILDEIDIMFG